MKFIASRTGSQWRRFASRRIDLRPAVRMKRSYAARSADAAVRTQKFCAVFGDGYDQPEAGDGFALDIAAIDRILPDRQPWTGRPPGRDHLGIKPVSYT